MQIDRGEGRQEPHLPQLLVFSYDQHSAYSEPKLQTFHF